MLSTNNAKLAIKILALLLAAAISFFFATSWVADSAFVQESLESVEESNQSVMAFSAATLATSLAITVFPDDFASALADTLADMNYFFVAILVVLLLEKILLIYGIKLTFALLIPCACIAGAIAVAAKKEALKGFAVRLCVLGLALAFVVPCSTHVTNYVAADLTAYVESTIAETEDGADKLNTAMEDGEDDKTIFEKLTDLFKTAIKGVSDLLLHFQNTIRRCMNSIAILILKNFIMPLLTFFVLKWILKETFNIVIPAPALKRRRRTKVESETDTALIAEGGESHEE